MRLRMWAIGAALLLTASAARADVKLAGICTEGMVLQQQSGAKLWGTAAKGEAVTVKFRDQEVMTKPDGQGRWSVTVQTGAAGGPFELTIRGSNTIQYKNILVGEVWVCSGQSNMEWSVGGCDAADKDYAFKAPHNAKLRIFQVARTPSVWPLSNTTGTWIEADPKNLGGWTAVGYYFGRNLQEKLDVPVGLIQSAWGGTRAEAWTSEPALLNDKLYTNEMRAWQNQVMTTPDGKATMNPNPNAMAVLYNGMIHPILNYRIRGAIWYQGESNAGQAYAYRSLFPLMIQDWRQNWQQPDFPFYFVQLAPFGSYRKQPGPSPWAELREAQLMTTKLKNTGMAVITDYGNEYDIHPTPKRPVGERLALLARARTYGEKVEDSGPEYKSVQFDGKKAILQFTHVGEGLTAYPLVPTLERKNAKGAAWRVKEKSEGAPLVGFTVAGKDGMFQPAEATIDGKTVVVTSAMVADPIAVRYGWADHPVCNLFNRDGLPATPFRTDDFPGVTAPKK